MTESDDFFKLLETYLIISFAHRPVRNLFRQATMRARPVLGELGDQTALKEYQDIRKLLEAPDIGDDSLKRINDLALSVFYFELRGRVSSASYAVCHIDYGRVLMGIKRGFTKVCMSTGIEASILRSGFSNGMRCSSNYLLSESVASKLLDGYREDDRELLRTNMVNAVYSAAPILRKRKKLLRKEASRLGIENIEEYALKVWSPP